MGNFEKLVVLAVLLVAAVVLAISFNRGSDGGEGSDPLSGAQKVLEQPGLETGLEASLDTSSLGHVNAERALRRSPRAGVGREPGGRDEPLPERGRWREA